MKKIVIQTISTAPMKVPLEKSKTEGRNIYKISTNARFKEFDYPVYYSMSGVIPQFIEKGDTLKLITFSSASSTEAIQNNINTNRQLCIGEFSKVCQDAGVSFEDVDLNIPYEMDNDVFSQMFAKIIDEIEQGSEIYVDNTLGDRIFCTFINSVVQFAEQCLDCKLSLMTWAKRDYDENGKPILTSYRLTDVTSVYYLTKLTGNLHSRNPKDAIQTVKTFLSM